MMSQLKRKLEQMRASEKREARRTADEGQTSCLVTCHNQILSLSHLANHIYVAALSVGVQEGLATLLFVQLFVKHVELILSRAFFEACSVSVCFLASSEMEKGINNNSE